MHESRAYKVLHMYNFTSSTTDKWCTILSFNSPVSNVLFPHQNAEVSSVTNTDTCILIHLDIHMHTRTCRHTLTHTRTSMHAHAHNPTHLQDTCATSHHVATRHLVLAPVHITCADPSPSIRSGVCLARIQCPGHEQTTRRQPPAITGRAPKGGVRSPKGGPP